MANNIYSGLSGILKELYENAESPDEKEWREFLNKQESVLGLELTPSKSQHYFKDMLYSDNPFLKLIPQDAQPSGGCMAVPLNMPPKIIVKP